MTGDSVIKKIRHYAGTKKRHLKRYLAPNAKTYYRSYVANDSISPLNNELVRELLSYNPKSAFEFGCGVGKNLELLRPHVEEHLGVDISEKAIEIAKAKNLKVICGDETSLKTIGSYDVVFTCSVLDHIKDIDSIVHELKRIAKVAIVIAETNTELLRFYYSHDYESFGFVKTGYEYVSVLPREGEAPYHIWHLEK